MTSGSVADKSADSEDLDKGKRMNNFDSGHFSLSDRDNDLNYHETSHKTESPLIKVVFKDDFTARKYRHKIEDFIMYMMVSSCSDQNEISKSVDLELNIYESQVCEINNKLNEQQNFSNQSKKRKSDRDCISRNKRKKIGEHTRSINFQETVEQNSSQTVLNPVNKVLSEKIRCSPITVSENRKDSNIEIIDIEVTEDKNFHEGSSNECLETYFENCSVQIGSYGYFNQGKKITLSKEGLTFSIPTLEGTDIHFKKLKIDYQNIVKVFVNFSSVKLELTFFVFSEKAHEIRNSISDYPDLSLPQKITILPSSISLASKSIIKKLFEPKNLLNKADANCVEELLELENLTNVNEDLNNDLIEIESSIVQENITTDDQEITLLCKVVRVGSYEYAKKRNFHVSKNDIKFWMPHSKDSSIVTVIIQMNKIRKVAVKFSAVSPILLFYVKKKVLKKVRNILGLSMEESLNKTGLPNNEWENGIMIFPEKLYKEDLIVRELTSLGKIEILSETAFNSIIEKLFRPPVKEVHFLSNNVRIGDYRYSGINLEVTLYNKGYRIKLQERKDCTEFVNILFNHINYCISHVSKNYKVIHFVLDKQFVVEKLLQMSRFSTCDKSKIETESKKQDLSKRCMTFFPKFEDKDSMSLIELLNKTGSKFVSEKDARQEVNKFSSKFIL